MRLPDGLTKRSEQCNICANSTLPFVPPSLRTGSRSTGRRTSPRLRRACEERGYRDDARYLIDGSAKLAVHGYFSKGRLAAFRSIRTKLRQILLEELDGAAPSQFGGFL